MKNLINGILLVLLLAVGTACEEKESSVEADCADMPVAAEEMPQGGLESEGGEEVLAGETPTSGEESEVLEAGEESEEAGSQPEDEEEPMPEEDDLPEGGSQDAE